MGCCNHSNHGESHEMVYSEEATILKIEGMTCGHCKMRVENALKAISGVETAEVNLAKKEAAVKGTVDKAQLIEAVEEAGYSVVS